MPIPRTKKYDLKFPLNAEQVAHIDEMLDTLFKDLVNGGIFPFEDEGDLLYFDGDDAERLPIGAAHTVLRTLGEVPEWGKVQLGSSGEVDGVLTVPNGGTGKATFTPYAVVAGGTLAAGPLQSLAGVGTAGQMLTSNGAGALPTFQTLVVPSSGIQSLLTNGDPLSPELIYDSFGDVITVT